MRCDSLEPQSSRKPVRYVSTLVSNMRNVCASSHGQSGHLCRYHRMPRFELKSMAAFCQPAQLAEAWRWWGVWLSVKVKYGVKSWNSDIKTAKMRASRSLKLE